MEVQITLCAELGQGRAQPGLVVLRIAEKDLIGIKRHDPAAECSVALATPRTGRTKRASARHQIRLQMAGVSTG